jgi:hypothetical protein
MMTLEEALAVLDNGERTPAKVLQFISSEGIVGERYHRRQCALALWLSKATGEVVSVGRWSAGYIGEIVCVVLSPVLQEAVVLFDNGVWRGT